MLKNRLDVIMYGIFFPALLYYMTHMKFKPHNGGPFSGEPIEGWFFGSGPGIAGVWEYRPLGTEITILVYNIFNYFDIGPYSYHGGPAFRGMNENLYLATILVALLFFVLFGSVYYIQIRELFQERIEVLSVYLIVVPIIVLTTHQLTPVDTPALFFFTLTIFFSHCNHNSSTIFLILAVIFGTLSKGSVMMLSFSYLLAYILVSPDSEYYRLLVRKFIVGSSTFLFTYIGIRVPDVIFGSSGRWYFSHGVRSDNFIIQFPINGDHISILIGLFMIFLIHITIPKNIGINKSREYDYTVINERAAIMVLYIASLPFLYGTLSAGNWRETRIFAPIFIVHSLYIIRIRSNKNIHFSLNKFFIELKTEIQLMACN